MITTSREFRLLTAPSAPTSLAGGNPPHPSHLQRAPLFPLKLEKLEGLPLPRPPFCEPAPPPVFCPRCLIKGCVFPASEQATGMCRSHDLQESEPALFESLQPIRHVLEQARYGIAARSFDSDRERDRRLQASLRKVFQEGGA